jgi:hypothetical protein
MKNSTIKKEIFIERVCHEKGWNIQKLTPAQMLFIANAIKSM